MTLSPLCGTGLITQRSAIRREGLLPQALTASVLGACLVVTLRVGLPAYVSTCVIGLAVGTGSASQRLAKAANCAAYVTAVPVLLTWLLLAPVAYVGIVALRLVGLVPVLGLACLGAAYGACTHRTGEHAGTANRSGADTEPSASTQVMPCDDAAATPPALPPALATNLLRLVQALRAERVRRLPMVGACLAFFERTRPTLQEQLNAVLNQLPLANDAAGAYLDALLPVPTGESAVQLLRSLRHYPARGKAFDFLPPWAAALRPLAKRACAPAPSPPPRVPMTPAQHKAMAARFVTRLVALSERERKAELQALVAMLLRHEEMQNVFYEELQLKLESLGSRSKDVGSPASHADDRQAEMSALEAARKELLGDASPKIDLVLKLVVNIEEAWLSNLEALPDPRLTPRHAHSLRELMHLNNDQLARMLVKGPFEVMLHSFQRKRLLTQREVLPHPGERRSDQATRIATAENGT